MYITTFYSFKGGVGRTLALMNSAAQLASRGRRVLLVDFDLEAPGLFTFFPPDLADACGIVDYVNEYTATRVAPDVRKFICETRLGESAIWIMPAGKQNHTYATELGAIDWQKLYLQEQGYLMFEDLKQQWEEHPAHFDYVLIDSRTGHTDVGGSRTRQLPDAVVLLFFPNEQNIDGMKKVVEDIRIDQERYPNRQLIFCPSNVPDLDDEHEILKRRLHNARLSLGYSGSRPIIHHYSSLALLDQSIFVLERAGTKLADEYRSLVEAVVKTNLRDRDGALAKLKDILRDRQMLSNTEQISQISEYHPNDGEIGWLLASVYERMGDITSSNEALNVAISSGFRVTPAKLRRAANSLSLGRRSEAIQDLTAVLNSEDASSTDFTAAVQLLQTAKAPIIDLVREPIAHSSIPWKEKLELAELLQFNSEGASFASDIARGALEQSNDPAVRRSAVTVLALSLIGLGRFGEAQDLLSSRIESILEEDSIIEVFNYAMAKWGADKIPPLTILGRVVELHEASQKKFGVNYWMCLAIAYGALGKLKIAFGCLDSASSSLGARRVFSPWSYFYVERNVIEQDINEIGKGLKEGLLEPEFVSRAYATKSLK